MVIFSFKLSGKIYYGARLMTGILRGSSLSKNDSPVSVMRGFHRDEPECLLKKTGWYVVRPDSYIACRSNNTEDQLLKKYMRAITYE
jgi:hypothetical protein